jgi:hypothetical protein
VISVRREGTLDARSQACAGGFNQEIGGLAKTIAGCKNPYLLGPIFSWKSIFGLFLVSFGQFRGS